ncbi:MAG: hypothetical protein Q8P30_01140 [Candidatus Uhrbacteria bacterium]|nr:hypothetical protein [Candidatus Uhrbacteria bacterium]
MLEEIFTYYNTVTAILALVWLLTYTTHSEVRCELWVLGLFAIFLMPLAFTFGDPNALNVASKFSQIGIVDIIFSFVLAGLAGTSFHAAFGKHYHKLPKPTRASLQTKASSQIWLMRLFIAFLLFIWGIVLLTLIFELAIPQAVFISAFVIAVYIVSHRRDLLADAIWSAFITTFIVFIASLLGTIFTGTDFSIGPISGTATFLDVPVDLLVWSAALGLALGPLYEFIRRLEVK